MANIHDDDCIAGEDYLNAYLRAINENPDIVLFEGLFIQKDQEKLGQSAAQKIQMVGCFGQVTCVLKKMFSMKSVV